jgi:predicted dehydrogenase
LSSTTKLGVAVIGLGHFGCKRVQTIAADPGSRLCVVADVLEERARAVGEANGCDHTQDWKDILSCEDVDAVIVSTSTRFLPQIAQAALEAGKHVLCEKPFGRNAAEVLSTVETAARNHLCLKVGYNHRYHLALEKAHALFQQGAIGRLHFLRCAYGHGGRPGYDQEWRTQSEFAGGGQLLDQGVHALDLFRWFGGEFSQVKAYMSTAFWPIAPVEDNVFALLRNATGCVASLHASWTNWKNTFVFEAFGEAGYLTVSGLGGHYGTERLAWGTRRTLGATPEEQHFEFPGPDQSLAREWQDFVDCIRQDRTPQSDGRDGWKTLLLADSIYRDASANGTIHASLHRTTHASPYEMTPADTETEPALLAQAHYRGENSR